MRTAVDVAAKRFLGDAITGTTVKTDRDFTTSVDFAIEREVRALLQRLTPSIGFLGEEDGHSGPTDRYWCLDPIDGTVNYVRGLPTCGVSLALVEGQSVSAGMVALPLLEEVYSVAPGSAPACNGRPIAASRTMTWNRAIVMAGDFATGTDAEVENRHRLATLDALARTALRVRMLGSAATDLAWLAAGRVDAVVMHSNHPWDTTAGVALALAAGCVVETLDGEPWTPMAPSLFARAPLLPDWTSEQAARPHAGSIVASERTRRGWTQQQLGSRVGRSESWVSQIERGVLPLNRIPTINELATALELDPNALMPESPAPEASPLPDRMNAIAAEPDAAQAGR